MSICIPEKIAEQVLARAMERYHSRYKMCEALTDNEVENILSAAIEDALDTMGEWLE